MTEAEWLTTGDPGVVLKRVRKRSDRKLRLFAAACCRRVWHLFPHPTFQEVVAATERFADGQITREQLLASKEPAKEAAKVARRAHVQGGQDWNGAQSKTYHAILTITDADPSWVARAVSGEAALAVRFALRPGAQPQDRQVAFLAEQRSQCPLLRDVLGNPFRRVSFDPSWSQGGPVRKLAQAAYDERRLPEGTLDPARLVVLADALEEGGCADEQVLSHLRGPDPHIRGCWVLDSLLDRE